jgi:cation transport regulator ChaC
MMRKYFAYGSNMCTARLQERVPSARPIGIAVLRGWKFVCNNISKDDSAKASIEEFEGGKVWGGLFEFDEKHENCLDKAEGVNSKTYKKQKITVELDDGSIVDNVLTYIGEKPVKDKKPYDWYLKYIVCGAKEHGLPRDYIDILEHIEMQEDNRLCSEKKKKCCR